MQEAHVKGRGRFAVFMAVVLAVGGLVAGQLARLTTSADGGQDETQVVSFAFDGSDAGKIILNGYTEAVPEWDYSLDYTLEGESTWVSGEHQVEYQLSDEEIASITAEQDIVVRVLLNEETDDTTPEETEEAEDAEGETEEVDPGDPEDEGSEPVPVEPEYLYYTIDIQEQTLPGTFAMDDENDCFVGVEELAGLLEWRTDESSDWTLYSEDSMPELTGNVSVQVRLRSTGTKLASEPQTFEFTQVEQPGDDKDPGDDDDPSGENKEPGEDDPKDDDQNGDEPGNKPGDDLSDEPGDDKPGDDKPGDDTPGDDKPGTTTPEDPNGSTEPTNPDEPKEPVEPGDLNDPSDPTNPTEPNDPTTPDKPGVADTEKPGDEKPVGNTGNGKDDATDIPVELPKTGANSIQQTEWLLVAGVGATLILTGGEIATAKRRKQ